MIRNQVLLTPELVSEIKKIARKQGLSQSEVIRKLLGRALAFDEGGNFKKAATLSATGIYDLSTFDFKNPRIDGFKEIFSVGGKTPEIKIVGDEVFRHYFKFKKFPSGFEYQVVKLSTDLKKFSLNKKLVVRRAYVVPGLANPPGPRFLGLDTHKVTKAIKKIFGFAIEHEYHLAENSQICAFFYPFDDPRPVASLLESDLILPYGGYAAPLNRLASRVEVFAVWGNNEGVQSFDTIDRYIVDAERDIISEKEIPQKTLMFCTTKKSQSEKIAVPQNRQFEQVLSDSEILEVGRVVKELTAKYGLRRVEFSFDGKETITFNESVPYEIAPQKLESIDRRGFIKIISSEKDIEVLRKLKLKQVAKVIVYIDKAIVENRAYDILNSVAGLPNKFTVLYPGLSATAHAMRILNDFGHTAIVVGNRIFKEGEEVIIRAKDTQIEIKVISRKSLKNLMVHLYDAKLYGKELVGGKATNLSLLKSKGFNVPHGWVLTTSFFDQIVSRSIDSHSLRQLEQGQLYHSSFVKKLSEFNFDIPQAWWIKFKKAGQFSPKKKYAVRSSATVEDQLEHSFAGQFKTFLNVGGNRITTNVSAVIKSTFSDRVAQYLSALKRSWSIKMAVIIQEMVEAEKSGVIFGKDIQTGNEDLLIIDTAPGLGEGVVEGTAKTQRIIYSRSKDAILDQNQSPKFLSRIEIDSLVEMALSVERMMGETQDIEWAIDKKNNIWLIQTRSLR
ncbi:MAG TPA: PEP/pyruvate-binding domain-containing protein [Candidatus Bathyarchaeia archaeon]|nr:PEP/pyruvate-binding domain-containing protein [Candidatus Bathyarchaeia archaeon]